MNAAIQKMLFTPGFHQISDPQSFKEHGLYAVVEVLPNGDCYQLDSEGVRDGLLGLEGWHDNAVVLGSFTTYEQAVLPPPEPGETNVH